jgi:hypothetical protein
LLTSELLRAVHSCREASLHRVAAAGLRVAQRLRDLHADRPEFRLGALGADLAALLSTARELTQATEVQADWLGTARRTYAPIGSLRVTGVLSAAVVSAAGYAGVVTYVCDQTGRIWSLGDVAPGPPERCQLAYGAPIDLGDASLDHQALGREGLHIQGARASVEGRLGAGRAVSAVRASGSAWTSEPLAGLWREPLEAQLARVWAARSQGGRGAERAGADLVYVRGVVQGVRAQTLELLVDGGVVVSGLAASDHAELPYRSNLRLLGCAPGLPLLVVGRVIFGRPRALVLLAVAPVPGTAEVRLDLPAALGDRVNLGLDVLQHAHVRGASPAPFALPEGARPAAADPLDPLRRRVYQVVSGGRSAVSEPAWTGMARDEAALQRAQLGTASQTLRALRHAAGRERLARAWLVAWMYLGAATARLQRISWTDVT